MAKLFFTIKNRTNEKKLIMKTFHLKEKKYFN